MVPATTNLLPAQPMATVISMPAELTTCSAVARAAAREDVSLNNLEPRTPTGPVPMTACRRVDALLWEGDAVFPADLPLMLLLPTCAQLQARLVKGAKPPVRSPHRVSPGVSRDQCGRFPSQLMCKRLTECCCAHPLQPRRYS